MYEPEPTDNTPLSTCPFDAITTRPPPDPRFPPSTRIKPRLITFLPIKRIAPPDPPPP